jgi:hypothetical protein
MYIWDQNHQVSKVDGKLAYEKPVETLTNDVDEHVLKRLRVFG